MWQVIEYKSAAIEQFRKGDLLQRVIDDIQSDAANAAEMKAAASGNPLILIQVELANNLRNLEALYSQHQREQHRLRDRLKWLEKTEERLAVTEAAYAENIRCRDANTRIVTEKDKEKILVELYIDGKVLKAKDNEKMRDQLISGVKEVTRNASAKVLFGTYRGFDVHIERMNKLMGGSDGFRLTLKGASGQEFKPNNLMYSFDEKLSLSGLFQRIDNFLAKGLDEAIAVHRDKAKQEQTELETVRAAMGKDFPQKEELVLTRENHSAVIRELQRMQDQPGYVSTWTPKTSLADDAPSAPSQSGAEAEKPKVISILQALNDNEKQTISFGEGGDRIEYRASKGLAGGYGVIRLRYRNANPVSIYCLCDDGLWHAIADTPRSTKHARFKTMEQALAAARQDAVYLGLEKEKAIVQEKVDSNDAAAVPDAPLAKKEKLYQQLTYSDRDGRTEYSITNQHNGYTLDGFVVRRTFYNQQVGSLGRSLYDDGHWYTTATAPAGLGLKQFATQEEALQVVRNNARERGLQEGSQVHPQAFGTTKLTFGKGNDKIEYTAFDHKSYHTLERAHYRESARYPVYLMCDDNLWRIPQCIHKNVKTRKFSSIEEALAFARRDAIEQGIQITENTSLENNYHARLEEAGFHATGKDFFGKNEYSSIFKAGDGGIYSLRLFQHEDKIGFHSQYEKDNFIDGKRTVKAVFDSLDEALDFVGGYHVPQEHLSQETPRMRMR